MGRNLPWNNAGAVSSHGSRQTKNVSETPTQSDQETRRGRSAQATATTGRPGKRLLSRTPSTSPPPGPPDVEPMFEGYEADDGYIMVEDEFQEVAQSFTAHLHHAEYKRLVKKAQQAPQKALPEPASPMSTETKIRLRGAARGDKLKDALEKMSKRSADELEDERIDDLWSGTKLAPLMVSQSQPKTSLVGIEKMSSTTKAAQGYRRNESETRGPIPKQRHDTTMAAVGRDGRTRQIPSITSQMRQESSDRGLNPADEVKPCTVGKFPRLVDQQDDTTGIHSSLHNMTKSTPRPLAAKSYLRGPTKTEEEMEREKKARLEEVPMFTI